MLHVEENRLKEGENMLPEYNNINSSNKTMASYTYNINRNINRISGYVDGKDAIKNNLERIYILFFILSSP
jgi:hypothetical protein